MQGFEAGALQDTAERQRYTPKSLCTGVPGDLSRLVEHAGAKQRISAYIPEGYMRDWIKKGCSVNRCFCDHFYGTPPALGSVDLASCHSGFLQSAEKNFQHF